MSQKLTALDEEGDPVVGSDPLVISARREFPQPPGATPADRRLQGAFHFPVNSAGRFTLRLEVEDHVDGRTATYDLPIVASAVAGDGVLR